MELLVLFLCCCCFCCCFKIFYFQVTSTQNVGPELTTPRSRLAHSTDRASQVHYGSGFFVFVSVFLFCFNIHFSISHISMAGILHYVLGSLLVLTFQFVNALFICMHFIYQSITGGDFFIWKCCKPWKITEDNITNTHGPITQKQ